VFRNLASVKLNEPIPGSANPRLQRDERVFVHRAKTRGLGLVQQQPFAAAQ
jgi:hypothetical protein